MMSVCVCVSVLVARGIDTILCLKSDHYRLIPLYISPSVSHHCYIHTYIYIYIYIYIYLHLHNNTIIDVSLYSPNHSSDAYTPHVWIILMPLVCGLIVLCVLCVPCVVAYCLYRKKKPRASSVPGNTAEGTVRYTTSDEQSRVGSPTLPSTDREGEVQINYHSGGSG